MVFQHGATLDDYWRAHTLASQAAGMGAGGRARWLASSSRRPAWGAALRLNTPDLALLAGALGLRYQRVTEADGLAAAIATAAEASGPILAEISALRPAELLAAADPPPVLIVHGTADLTVPLEHGGAIYKHRPGDRAHLHRIPAADHTLNRIDWEAELIQTTVDWLLPGL